MNISPVLNEQSCHLHVAVPTGAVQRRPAIREIPVDAGPVAIWGIPVDAGPVLEEHRDDRLSWRDATEWCRFRPLGSHLRRL